MQSEQDTITTSVPACFIQFNNNEDDNTITFTLASRASQLAKIQTYIVRDALVAAFPPPSPSSGHKYKFATAFMRTAGDKNQTQALYNIGGVSSGGKSLWTEELEAALLRGPAPKDKKRSVAGAESKTGASATTGNDDDVAPLTRADMLVHSLKDVPTALPPGCTIGAIMEREDPVDCLVMKQGLDYKSLDELPEGSVIGTSSIRRVAQLRRKHPKLELVDVRGNLNTRLAKLDSPTGSYTALILAKAGLIRLGMGHRITQEVGAPMLYHAVGQGALGIEVREGDTAVEPLCKVLNHRPTEWMCRAERAMLRDLEGGCSVPVGVHTALDNMDGGKTKLTITGTVTSLDGRQHAEHTLEVEVNSSADAENAGERLARILIETGAKQILEQIAEAKAARRTAERS